jgi:hypothetical protein
MCAEGTRQRWLAFAALVLVLLCLIPPDGMLSDNEETYFQVAARSVSSAPISPETGVFDSSRHRIVADHLLGWLIALAGFTGAQIVARALAALAYAAALLALCRRFELSALDAILAVIVFALLGQTMVGGEWLFNGVEAKVAAYALVLAGLAAVMGGKRLVGAAGLFATATYFHFLVGIFWFSAAMVLNLIEERGNFRRIMAVSALFLLLVAPLLGAIAWTRYVESAAVAIAGMPPADIIYSQIRAPHHTAPFLAAGTFLTHWLPGYLLAVGMLIGALAVARLPETARLRSFGSWLALLLAYLFLALLAAYLDRDTAFLGKFYLFRPASLVLLLWLLLVFAALDQLGLKQERAVKLVALALVAPLFLLNAVNRIAGERQGLATHAAEKQALTEFLAQNASRDAVVLIDPGLEFSFLDFERRTSHPMLVTWKFDPTSDPEIREWYRRMEFRKELFAEGCHGAGAYRVDFLLTTAERAAPLAESCGPVVYRTGAVALLRRTS